MIRQRYYARLNDNDVCVELVTRVEKLENVKGYINIPDYNEDLIYRKWLGDQWSQEKHEPKIDKVVAEKISELEKRNEELFSQNKTLKAELENKDVEIQKLLTQVNDLSDTVAELVLGGMM